MRPFITAIAAFAFLPTCSGAMAQQTTLPVPQSILHQHQEIISRLEYFASGIGPDSVAVKKALIFLKQHYAKEEEFVLPPLSLLSRLSKGEVSKDMEPAIAMAERTKAASSELASDHVQITALMNDLVEAARKKGNVEQMRLATRIAAQSLNDMEVTHPTAILIGDYVRQRLSKP